MSETSRDWIFVGDHRPASVQEIARAVAAHYGYELEFMMSKRKGKKVCRARYMVMYLARHRTTKSTTALGAFFRMDHTSILFGARRMAQLIDSDPAYAIDAHVIGLTLGNGHQAFALPKLVYLEAAE